MHTCIKLGVAFWDYLGDRIGVAAQAPVPTALPDLIRCRGQLRLTSIARSFAPVTTRAQESVDNDIFQLEARVSRACRQFTTKGDGDLRPFIR